MHTRASPDALVSALKAVCSRKINRVTRLKCFVQYKHSPASFEQYSFDIDCFDYLDRYTLLCSDLIVVPTALLRTTRQFHVLDQCSY